MHLPSESYVIVKVKSTFKIYNPLFLIGYFTNISYLKVTTSNPHSSLLPFLLAKIHCEVEDEDNGT